MSEGQILTPVRRTAWTAVGVLMAFALIAGGCGSSHKSSNQTGTTVATTSAVPTTLAPPTTQAPSTTAAPSTTTNPAGPSFATVSGTYVGGTADGGSLYIRSDGASRFLAPDDITCAACSTADSPIASIDFALKSLSSTGPGAYSAAGVITATSDGPWASAFTGSPAPGSAVSVTIASGGHLTLGFLPASDVLTFSSPSALYTNTPPCTVAAVTGPVQGAQSGATVAGVTCAVDKQWVAASVDSHGIDEVMVLEAAFTKWVVVDRATVCNHHDVPTDLYNAACGSD